jgi:hypothetical protein
MNCIETISTPVEVIFLDRIAIALIGDRLQAFKKYCQIDYSFVRGYMDLPGSHDPIGYLSDRDAFAIDLYFQL